MEYCKVAINQTNKQKKVWYVQDDILRIRRWPIFIDCVVFGLSVSKFTFYMWHICLWMDGYWGHDNIRHFNFLSFTEICYYQGKYVAWLYTRDGIWELLN